MMPTTRAASTPSRRVTTRASNMQGSSADPGPGGPGGNRDGNLDASALVAETADLESVAGRHETMGAADLGLERGDAGAHELDHPAAAGADEVIVMLAAVHVLVEETVLPEPLF